jgi:hypothetical protein
MSLVSWAKHLLNRAMNGLRSIGRGKVTAYGSGDGEPLRAAALHCAFEELLDQVETCEREWRLMDRIDLGIRIRKLRDDRESDGQA